MKILTPERCQILVKRVTQVAMLWWSLISVCQLLPRIELFYVLLSVSIVKTLCRLVHMWQKYLFCQVYILSSIYFAKDVLQSIYIAKYIYCQVYTLPSIYIARYTYCQGCIFPCMLLQRDAKYLVYFDKRLWKYPNTYVFFSSKPLSSFLLVLWLTKGHLKTTWW